MCFEARIFHIQVGCSALGSIFNYICLKMFIFDNWLIIQVSCSAVALFFSPPGPISLVGLWHHVCSVVRRHPRRHKLFTFSTSSQKPLVGLTSNFVYMVFNPRGSKIVNVIKFWKPIGLLGSHIDSSKKIIFYRTTGARKLKLCEQHGDHM